MPPWVVRLAMAIPLRRSLPAVLAYHRQIHYRYAQLRPHRLYRVTRLLFVARPGSPVSDPLSPRIAVLPIVQHRSLPSDFHVKAPLPPPPLFQRYVVLLRLGRIVTFRVSRCKAPEDTSVGDLSRKIDGLILGNVYGEAFNCRCN